jgi:ribosomal protein S18 acetylase RimI-like enzyme
MTIALRPARNADEPGLLLLLERLADFPLPAWRTGPQIAGADRELLIAAVRQPTPDISILVAEDPSATLAGFSFATTRQDYFTGRLHAHVEVLTIAAGFEGKGIARALMQATETWARDRGYPHVTLNVFATNDRARNLYERLGYRPETLHYLKPLGAEVDP